MDKVIVIRHSDEQSQYDEYVNKHGLHFTEGLAEYASSLMQNKNGQSHKWNANGIAAALIQYGFTYPDTSSIGDIVYTANMAYADFNPGLLNEKQCIEYSINVANDIDGYEGIQFSRWMADVKAKNVDVDFSKFI